MEHRSTFNLVIDGALIQQWDIMAEIERDRIGEWYIAAIYSDCLEKNGKRCTGSRDWVRIPGTHPLYNEFFMHFLTDCRHDIDERWNRHSWRYEPRSLVSAGRTM